MLCGVIIIIIILIIIIIIIIIWNIFFMKLSPISCLLLLSAHIQSRPIQITNYSVPNIRWYASYFKQKKN